MSLRKGSKVWVPDRDFAWLPAEVLESSEKQVSVQTDSINKQIVVVTPEKIFPRDADEDEHGGVEDMTRLAYFNEPGVLYCTIFREDMRLMIFIISSFPQLCFIVSSTLFQLCFIVSSILFYFSQHSSGSK
ncbi:myosin-15 [Trifolium repens]|nr:myosin-15 [Trifolium repens]